MSKLELIKEVNINGEVYYWSELHGTRVTPYTMDEKKAIEYFNEFIPVSPSKEVIKTKNI